jgi:hypothetical protein
MVHVIEGPPKSSMKFANIPAPTPVVPEPRKAELAEPEGSATLNPELRQRIRNGLTEQLATLEVQEILDTHGASDEMLEILKERETRAVGQMPDLINADGKARESVVWCMAHLVECSRMLDRDRSWFEAVMLFDVYCCRCRVKVQDYPIVCAALIRLLQKVDNAVAAPRDHDLINTVTKLSEWLRQMGHEVSPSSLTVEALEVHEMAILEALRWQIKLPTVDQWMSAFCARMSALTRQGLMPILVPVWQQSMPLARALFMRFEMCSRLSPQHVANGLLCMGCVAHGLISPEAVGLDSLSDLEGIFLPGGPEIPSAYLGGMNEFSSELLQLATGSSLGDLQEDCKMVLTELKEARSEQGRTAVPSDRRDCDAGRGVTMPEEKDTGKCVYSAI